MPDCRNAKEHYQLFIRKKNRTVVKWSKKYSVLTEYGKSLCKLSKTNRQAEKVVSKSSLYSDTKK